MMAHTFRLRHDQPESSRLLALSDDELHAVLIRLDPSSLHCVAGACSALRRTANSAVEHVGVTQLGLPRADVSQQRVSTRRLCKISLDMSTAAALRHDLRSERVSAADAFTALAQLDGLALLAHDSPSAHMLHDLTASVVAKLAAANSPALPSLLPAMKKATADQPIDMLQLFLGAERVARAAADRATAELVDALNGARTLGSAWSTLHSHAVLGALCVESTEVQRAAVLLFGWKVTE